MQRRALAVLQPFWQHMQALKPQQLAPVYRYVEPSGAGYKQLNRQLRYDHADVADLEGGLQLDALIAEGPRLESELTVYRGFMDSDYSAWMKSEPRVRIADRAFMSCSLSQEVATLHAVRDALTPLDLEGAVLLKIRLPAGQALLCVHLAAGMTDVPEDRDEKEILLPRNTTLEIDSVAKQGNLQVATAHVVPLQARL